MIHLKIVQKEQEAILYSLLQKYLYEMTQYYRDDMDENGNFSYPWLPMYFGVEGRAPYFIYDDDTRIGFAMVNTHSWTDEKIDNSLAEFTIFPLYRRNGNGMKAMDALIGARGGSWQLKYSTENGPGAAFWKKVSAKYGGKETPLEGTEIAVTIYR